MFIDVPKPPKGRSFDMTKISGRSELPESLHVTKTLFPDVAIRGCAALPPLLLKLIGGPKLEPLLLLAANNI